MQVRAESLMWRHRNSGRSARDQLTSLLRYLEWLQRHDFRPETTPAARFAYRP